MPGEQTYLDMRLNLRPQLLQVLHDGTVDSAAKVGMLIGNSPRLVANTIEDVLWGEYWYSL